MPKDKNGTELNVGDRVTVEFLITALDEPEELYGVTVQAINNSEYYPKLRFKSNQVVSQKPINGNATDDDKRDAYIYGLLSGKEPVPQLSKAFFASTEPIRPPAWFRSEPEITDEQYDSMAEGILTGHISAEALDELPESALDVIKDKLWSKSREEGIKRYRSVFSNNLFEKQIKEALQFVKNVQKDYSDKNLNLSEKNTNCLVDESAYITESNYRQFADKTKLDARDSGDEAKPIFKCPGWGYTDFLINLLETGRLSKEMNAEIRNEYVDIIYKKHQKSIVWSILKECISKDVEAARSAIREYNKKNHKI